LCIFIRYHRRFNSVKAVRENIVCLKVLLPRIMELLKEGECSHVQPYANAPGHA